MGRRQLGSTYLSMQHPELVPKHHDLELLELLRAGTQRYELEHAAQHQIAKRPEQEPTRQDQRDGRTTLRPTRALQRWNRVNAPHRLVLLEAPRLGQRRGAVFFSQSLCNASRRIAIAWATAARVARVLL